MADSFDPVSYRQQSGSLPANPTDSFDPVAYRQQKGALPPENSPDNPMSAPLFTDTDRTKMGFASPDVTKNFMGQNGFKNAHQNKAGDWVVQDSNGHWIKDATNFWPNSTGTPGTGFFPRLQESLMSAHPANWAEGHAGQSLPVGGQVLGEGAAALAAPETGGASLLAAGTAGGVGAGAGEAARQWIGRQMGVNTTSATDPENLKAIGEQAAMGGLAAPVSRGVGAAWKGAVEAAPKVIAALPEPIQAGMRGLSQGAKNIASKIMGSIASVEPESAAQFMKSPTSVLKAEPLPIAQQAERDAQATMSSRGRAVGAAQDALSASEGSTPIDARAKIAQMEQTLAEARSRGLISEDEANKIRGLGHDYLTTTTTTPGVGLHTPVEPRMVPSGEYGELKEGFAQTGPEQYTQDPTSVTTPVTTYDKLREGIGRLSPGTDIVPKSGMNPTPLANASDKYLNQLELLRGKLSDLATGSGSKEAQALEQANSIFSRGKDAAKVVKPLESDPVQENFIRGLSNQGKNAQLDALQELVQPKTMDEIRNMIAQRQFGTSKVGKALLGGASANRSMSLGGAAAVRNASPWTLLPQGGSQ